MGHTVGTWSIGFCVVPLHKLLISSLPPQNGFWAACSPVPWHPASSSLLPTVTTVTLHLGRGMGAGMGWVQLGQSGSGLPCGLSEQDMAGSYPTI